MFSKVKRLIQLIKSYEERFNKIDLTLGKIETRLNQSIDSDCTLQRVDTFEEFKVGELFGNFHGM